MAPCAGMYIWPGLSTAHNSMQPFGTFHPPSAGSGFWLNDSESHNGSPTIALRLAETPGHHDQSAKWEHGCQSLDIYLPVIRRDSQQERGNLRWGGAGEQTQLVQSGQKLAACPVRCLTLTCTHSHKHTLTQPPTQRQWRSVVESCFSNPPHNTARLFLSLSWYIAGSPAYGIMICLKIL